ncbi:hypothetical protein FZC79_18460 [Rossellomorea vietnamensis]|uniref:Uncharacterized protein n=1 Tax=Rossellomorea vietnamensis TaxID=218284 RepID=A0A5D4K7P7_9BACI|nr:hypothetical protein [Rossellomorea vietnamensis]TYR73427.1 hypothetical protein FZC79_18460 [Rossellomorea vietnamensis]
MKLFFSITAAFLVTWVGSVNSLYFLSWLLYRDSIAEPGNLEGLSLLILFVFASPIIFITLSFLFYKNMERLRTKGVVLGGVIGFYITNLIDLIVVRMYVQEFVVLPFIILGFLFINRPPIRNFATGISAGLAVGFIAAYHIIVIVRWLDNTLVASFYSLSLYGSLSYGEMLLNNFIITVGLVAGIVIDRHLQKRK